ncbi:structural maintenance of chromosomes protein 6 [Hyposmocoma kahamanoa]|uniref:structural maintenance of chromosomes protein 6 n=1 Tax=Hyposmocoma kahamanoa TaxID=1477025 RepID=UPI000E6D7857|nr:structural maintenance of chromosomes protein 6 [Hyposmocoma kahamanoa]
MDVDVFDEDVDGCIESIHVRNFFCHDNLEVNFNRNLNFIVGRNGSGKSAILTALVVGLGSRASATNRGNSLTSFIKNGANSAVVEVKVKNSSRRAYKHEVYGNYITIVRNINASGGSSYKIKSATGEIKSTKFEEVNAICLAHDIQVDNPISVLNQDDARSFHASDAKKKYSLFRKATNLDQTETNYNSAIANCDRAKNVLKRKLDAFIELEKEYKKWKANHEQMKSRDEIEAQKQALQNEYYWSEIAELEREAATVQAQYDKQNARIERLMERLRNMEQNFGSNSDTIDKLKSELQDKRAHKTSLEEDLRAHELEVRETQAVWQNAQSIMKKHTELLNREKRNVAQLEAEIQNIDSGSATSLRADLEKRLAEASEAARAACARYDTASNDAAQARAHAARAQAGAEQQAARAKQHQAGVEQLRQQLRELSSRGNDSLAVYGNNMVELVRRVKQAAARGAFSAPPRGPIGAYLKVKEKKWGGALEHIIGGSIQSFCVNTPDDSRKLFEIMGQVYGNSGKPAVTCSKFLSKQHDVSRNRVRASGFLCALDSLEISDPVVANFLIDNIGMESVLLVPNHDDATRLSDTEENVPENCAKIVTLDCSEYYPAPNYRSYGGSSRPSRFLHLSTAERKT